MDAVDWEGCWYDPDIIKTLVMVKGDDRARYDRKMVVPGVTMQL